MLYLKLQKSNVSIEFVNHMFQSLNIILSSGLLKSRSQTDPIKKVDIDDICENPLTSLSSKNLHPSLAFRIKRQWFVEKPLRQYQLSQNGV